MAEYEVTVQFDNVSSVGGSMTGAQIRDALEALVAGQRLSYNYLDDKPTIPTGDEITGAEIRDLLEALTAGNRLSITKLDDITKANITTLTNALTYRATGNLYDSAFQNASMNTPLSWDFWIADGVNTSVFGTAIEDGDWVISLTTDPQSYAFSNTSLWYVIKFSKLPGYAEVFKYRDNTNEDSGIEAIIGNSYAEGDYSFANGHSNLAYGERSQATGYGSVAYRYGQRSYAAGYFSYRGDCQIKEHILKYKTTNATPIELTAPATFLLNVNKTYKLEIDVLGRSEGGTYAKSWKYEILVSGNGTVMVANPVVTAPSTWSIGTPAFSCAYALKADVPARVQLTVTGLLSTPVYWIAHIKSLEVADYSAGTPSTLTIDGSTLSYAE